MKGAKFDCSRESRYAHENADVPIRVPVEAFKKFEAEMIDFWAEVVCKLGSPRRFRLERLARRTETHPDSPEPGIEEEYLG